MKRNGSSGSGWAPPPAGGAAEAGRAAPHGQPRRLDRAQALLAGGRERDRREIAHHAGEIAQRAFGVDEAGLLGAGAAVTDELHGVTSFDVRTRGSPGA